MKPVLGNTLAVVGGILLGAAANMGLILLGSELIPAPAGVDVTSPESIAESMDLFRPRHFVFPFLAHAVGTLVGAGIVGCFARTYRLVLALMVGVFFLAGGIANAVMIPAPRWFIGLDLVVAYLPMAWIGGTLAVRLRS